MNKPAINGESGRISRPRRCRTGCWTCRTEGYKCDEKRPACGRCRRLNKPCLGYGLRLKWQHHIKSSVPKTTARRQKHYRSPNTNTDGDIKLASDEDFRMNAVEIPTDQRPRHHSSSVADSSESISSLDFPASNSSVTSPEYDIAPYNRVSTVLSPQEDVTVAAPYLTMEEYRLFHHFTTVVSGFLCAKSIRNPFQLHFTSMALEKGPLQSAIFSVAAAHLAKALPQTQSSLTFLPISRYHGQNARRFLLSALQNPARCLSDSTLASVLMLQLRRYVVDMEEEAIEVPECHLSAAKEIIHLRGGPMSFSTPCSQFLLSLFNYHDISGSIAHKRAPFIPDSPSLNSAPGSQFLSCASEILQIAGSISLLQPPASRCFQFQSQVQVLEQRLEVWTPPLASDHDQDTINTAVAYHGAACIYLFRVAYNIGAPHPRTLARVRRSLDAIAKVPSSSGLVFMHVWPLFTAGCEAIDPDDRDFTLRRLDEMYMRRRIPSLRRVREAMEAVWMCKDREGLGDRPDRMTALGCLEALSSLGVQVDLA